MNVGSDDSPTTSATVRQTLRYHLTIESDFRAFCLDCYPEVHQKFAAGMNRPEIENILLQSVDPPRILGQLRKYLRTLKQGVFQLGTETTVSHATATGAALHALLMACHDPMAIDAAALAECRDLLLDIVAPYTVELDAVAQAYRHTCSNRRSSSAWVRQDWPLDVLRWLMRLGLREPAAIETHLRPEEWALLVAAPFLVWSELEHTVLSSDTFEQALLTEASGLAEAAFTDAEQRTRLLGFLTSYDSLRDRARRIHRELEGQPSSVILRRKLSAFVEWLRYRFAQQERTRWQRADVSIREMTANSFHGTLHLFNSTQACLGKLLRAGRMTPAEIYEEHLSSQSYELRLPGRPSIRIRPPLLMGLLLCAERLAVHPVDLGESVLHHLDIEDLEVGELCSEASKAVCEPTSVARHVVLYARCSFPVIDFALTEIAEEIDVLLRGPIRRLDTAVSLSGVLPLSCTADIEPLMLAQMGSPTFEKERPRPCYAKPHLSFTMDAPRVRNLLMGTQLWEKRSLAFRELYQNALDACRYRRCRSRYHGVPYEPQIRFHEGQDLRGRYFVECEDNGIGMNLATLATCFSRAGQRFHDSAAFHQEQTEWRTRESENVMYPNSQFGIGVFSYFLVADEVEVETCRLSHRNAIECEARFLVCIPAASSLFSVRELSDSEAKDRWLQKLSQRNEVPNGTYIRSAGTVVRLYLNQTLAQKIKQRNARPWLKLGANQAEKEKAFYRHQTLLKELDPVEGDVQFMLASEEPTEGCIDTLKSLIWFTDVSITATVADRPDLEQPVRWFPMKLAPWIAAYCEPIENIAELRHFWVIKRGLILRGTPSERFVSMDGLPSVHRDDRMGFLGDEEASGLFAGRVLVDGIATDHVVPCAIINLWREEQAILSVDRQRIREYPRERVLKRLSERTLYIDRPNRDSVKGDWMDALAEHWPLACEHLAEQMGRDRRSWALNVRCLDAAKHEARWIAQLPEQPFWPKADVLIKATIYLVLAVDRVILPPAGLLLALWCCHTWELPGRIAIRGKIYLEPDHISTHQYHSIITLDHSPNLSFIHDGVLQRWRKFLLNSVAHFLMWERFRPYEENHPPDEHNIASWIFTTSERFSTHRDTSWFFDLEHPHMLPQAGTPLETWNVSTCVNWLLEASLRKKIPIQVCAQSLYALANLFDWPTPHWLQMDLSMLQPGDDELLAFAEEGRAPISLLWAVREQRCSLSERQQRMVLLCQQFKVPIPSVNLELIQDLLPINILDLHLLKNPWSFSSRKSQGLKAEEVRCRTLINVAHEAQVPIGTCAERLLQFAKFFGWTITLHPQWLQLHALGILSDRDLNLFRLLSFPDECEEAGQPQWPWLVLLEHTRVQHVELTSRVERLSQLALAFGWALPLPPLDAVKLLDSVSEEELILLSKSAQYHRDWLAPSDPEYQHMLEASEELRRPLADCIKRRQEISEAMGIPMTAVLPEMFHVLDALSPEDHVLLRSIPARLASDNIEVLAFSAPNAWATNLGVPMLMASQRLSLLASSLGVEIPVWREVPTWPSWLLKGEHLHSLVLKYPDNVWLRPQHWLWLAVRLCRSASELLSSLAQIRRQLGGRSDHLAPLALAASEPIVDADLIAFEASHKEYSFLSERDATPPDWTSARRQPLELIRHLLLSREHPQSISGLRETVRRHDTIAAAIGWHINDPHAQAQQEALVQMDDAEWRLLIGLLEEIPTEGSDYQPPARQKVITRIRTPRAGHLVALAAVVHRPLYWIDHRLHLWQSNFGTKPPEADETYLGLRWDWLVAESRHQHPGFDDALPGQPRF